MHGMPSPGGTTLRPGPHGRGTVRSPPLSGWVGATPALPAGPGRQVITHHAGPGSRPAGALRLPASDQAKTTERIFSRSEA